MPRNTTPPTDPNKETRLELRASQSEKAQFQENAGAFGFSNTSEYVRWLNREFSQWLKAGRVPMSRVRPSKQPSAANDDKVIYHLSKVGTNLNQIAHRLNIDENKVAFPVIEGALAELHDVLELAAYGRR